VTAEQPPVPQPRGRIYLGWQYAVLHPDPGPPPRRPVPPEHPKLSGEWLAAHRREENRLDRPLKLAAGAAVAATGGLIVVAAGGWLPAPEAAVAFALCAAAGAYAGRALWRGERALRERVAGERRRVERFRTEQERRLFGQQAEHARQAREWQARRFAFENQKRWYAVPLPPGIDRVDVAGGTLPGWSALLTMAGAYRLAAGGEVTVLDLTGGSVAADLVAVATAAGIGPNVWVLPGDLPRLDLTGPLSPEALADVLALTADGAEERDLALETGILERALAALGTGITMPRIAAGLRILARVGDPYDEIGAGLLTEEEASRLSALFGGGPAEQAASSLQARVGTLAAAATDPRPLPPSDLRVVAIDGQAGAAPAKILGGFVVAALTHLLAGQKTQEAQEPWRHTVFLLGAERLGADALDRLTELCETTRTGLMLAYRAIPGPARQRIGRGNAAVAFMRLGNAEDAKAASEQIGTQHRFVVSQLTETVGSSVTDTTAGAYTSTVSGSASLGSSAGDSASTGKSTGRTDDGGFGPFAGTASRTAQESGSTSQSESITAGISASTAWGASTSTATGSSEALARSVQRSREFVVEASELQRLPPTAMILSYATSAGRQVLMADVNPAIGGLAMASLAPVAEAGRFPAAAPPDSPPRPAADEPNLGPPDARLDWRRPGSRPMA
jgi:hypothetical protein